MSRPPGHTAFRLAALVAFLVTCAALAVVLR